MPKVTSWLFYWSNNYIIHNVQVIATYLIHTHTTDNPSAFNIVIVSVIYDPSLSWHHMTCVCVCALARRFSQTNYNASLSLQNEFIYVTIGKTQSLDVAVVCHGRRKRHFVSKLTQVRCFKGVRKRKLTQKLYRSLKRIAFTLASLFIYTMNKTCMLCCLAISR